MQIFSLQHKIVTETKSSMTILRISQFYYTCTWNKNNSFPPLPQWMKDHVLLDFFFIYKTMYFLSKHGFYWIAKEMLWNWGITKNEWKILKFSHLRIITLWSVFEKKSFGYLFLWPYKYYSSHFKLQIAEHPMFQSAQSFFKSLPSRYQNIRNIAFNTAMPACSLA